MKSTTDVIKSLTDYAESKRKLLKSDIKFANEEIELEFYKETIQQIDEALTVIQYLKEFSKPKVAEELHKKLTNYYWEHKLNINNTDYWEGFTRALKMIGQYQMQWEREEKKDESI